MKESNASQNSFGGSEDALFMGDKLGEGVEILVIVMVWLLEALVSTRLKRDILTVMAGFQVAMHQKVQFL